MSTSSNSNSTTIQQTGASLGTSPSVSTFKDADYGQQALGTKENLRRFFAALNPIAAQIKLLGDSGVSISNFDCDLISYNLTAYQSEWTNVSLSGLVTGGTGIICFDGSSGKIAVRKDAWGHVDVYVFVTTSGAGTLTGATVLPQEMWPIQTTQFPIAGSTSFFTISSAGVITLSGAAVTMAACQFLSYPAATLSPGTLPPFPVYLKIAPGRTPIGVQLLGAKPQQSQDVFKTSTGVQGLPLACGWTFLGSSTKAADGSLINQVRIDNVPGLVSGINYILNFLVFYGQTGSSSAA